MIYEGIYGIVTEGLAIHCEDEDPEGHELSLNRFLKQKRK